MFSASACPARTLLPDRLTTVGKLAANLGIRFEIIGISDLFKEFTSALDPLFAGLAPDITEENIQSRIRGNLLMALSNKYSARSCSRQGISPKWP